MIKEKMNLIIILSLILLAAFTAVSITGCTSTSNNEDSKQNSMNNITSSGKSSDVSSSQQKAEEPEKVQESQKAPIQEKQETSDKKAQATQMAPATEQKKEEAKPDAANTVAEKKPEVKEVFAINTSFRNSSSIPLKYAFRDVPGGKNISLPISWTGIPEGTKSVALLIYDLHPIAENWVHWAVINIPANTEMISEGASNTPGMPQGCIELTNSYGEKGYGGPCPPSGSGNHKYKIIVYALNADKVNLNGTVTVGKFQSTLNGKVLAKAEIFGYFKQ